MNNKRLLEIRKAAEQARKDYDLAHSTDACFEDVEELLKYVQALREQIDVLHGYVNGKPVEITTESAGRHVYVGNHIFGEKGVPCSNCGVPHERDKQHYATGLGVCEITSQPTDTTAIPYRLSKEFTDYIEERDNEMLSEWSSRWQ